MDVIQATNLTHFYGTKKVFENINFSIQQGKITGLLGKNGTGKTTLINIINSFLTPTSGNIKIFGEPAQNLGNYNKSKIGYLIEGHIQYDFMSIEQIEYFYSGFYPKWNAKKFYELIDLMHLKSDHKISKMSCGQRSQVALGLIFAQEPELIILDDFSMGLDSGYRRLFIDYLKHYVAQNNITVFVTSHIVQDMEKLINEVMIFDEYEIKYKESLPEFMRSMHLYSLPKNEFKITLQQKFNSIIKIEEMANEVQLLSQKDLSQIRYQLKASGISQDNLKEIKMTLEDAFVGLTGRY